ncbi:MAG: ribonuclease HII [Pseudomonadota bacterium]
MTGQRALPLPPVPALGPVAGIDEAGRGPLAGPVVAAAVVLDPANTPAGIDDSKRLKQRARESLAAAIRASALHYHVAVVSSGDVDRLNILQATMRAMALAADGIDATLGEIRVDGNRAPTLTARHEGVPVTTWVGGDGRCAAIAAASILAKTTRDALMCDYDARWPEYGFAKHKGYGTAAHLTALREHGPCDIHRISFAPVRAAREGS